VLSKFDKLVVLQAVADLYPDVEIKVEE